MFISNSVLCCASVPHSSRLRHRCVSLASSVAPIVVLLALSACSSTSSGSDPAAPTGDRSSAGSDDVMNGSVPSPMQPGAVDSGFDASRTNEPISESSVVVAVSGLACPKCASNVDQQLERLPGVQVRNVDMKLGLVSVDFGSAPHPTPAQLAKAVDDAGLTFVGWSPSMSARSAP